MGRFKIFCGSTLIGWSDLEAGDPSMGVAFGLFLPTSAYADFQGSPIENQNHTSLSITTAENTPIEASGGIHIEDLSSQLDEQAIEITALGMESAAYKSLFPEHVLAYKRQFHNVG
ncbi:hypothetical protein [Stutzerimonas zhaodongensis]|uniref:hypothetical protein n=1 Tax=Stutzerimonas TaxID=2901164 RepID=UPI00388E0A21